MCWSNKRASKEVIICKETTIFSALSEKTVFQKYIFGNNTVLSIWHKGKICKEKCLFMLLPPIISVADAEAFILVKIRDEKDY